MYRMIVRNNQTGVAFYEYGFSLWMMKRLYFYFNETDQFFFRIYDIVDITKIVFTPKTFIKCLTNYTKMV